jgi:hypothetical protein
METKQVGIHFGALADDLSIQLKDQGLKYDPKTIENFEKALDGLVRLRFLGVVIDSQYNKILPKLHKKIMQHVAKANKMKYTP